MKVIRAEVLGFCFGVKRAVAAAEDALEKNSGDSCHPVKKIYTLGPLIHNPVVLDSLKQKGLAVIESDQISKIQDNATVIIRAHGTTPAVMRQLQTRGLKVLDCTCPRVHASQLLAKKWTSEGYTVVIAGDKNHGEVTGIAGYAGDHVIVVQSAVEAEFVSLPEKSILIAQTTFNPKEFEKISDVLKQKQKDIPIFNTICSATMERQNALRALAGKTDGIIVIGGKNSANTRRLFETAQAICGRAALIENASQIPDEFFTLNVVALTAGASTPDTVIDQVESDLLSRH